MNFETGTESRTSALQEDKVLADLHNLRIEHNYINRAHEKGSINGGDGQVWFADLTNTQTPVRVAVKELRPAGEFKDRSALVMVSIYASLLVTILEADLDAAIGASAEVVESIQAPKSDRPHRILP